MVEVGPTVRKADTCDVRCEENEEGLGREVINKGRPSSGLDGFQGFTVETSPFLEISEVWPPSTSDGLQTITDGLQPNNGGSFSIFVAVAFVKFGFSMFRRVPTGFFLSNLPDLSCVLCGTYRNHITN